jgi:hypothetical protein
MSHTPTDRRDPPNEPGQSAEPIRYPTNHVLGIFDTAEQLAGAVEPLVLRERGASLLRFFGRFTIEELARPDMT